jgi:hypothetical protein
MSMDTHIIDHEIKLMKMGGREEILLERETISLIILPESSNKTDQSISEGGLLYVDEGSYSYTHKESPLFED